MRSEMQPEMVSISELAMSVFSSLQQASPERRVRVTVQPGMHAYGDAKLLGVVLENLIQNSWKFTGKKAYPEIEVGCTELNGETVFFVRDNGAGFDMAYAGKLFAPFQRLHRVSEFPGDGIGLATVQRIIHRHGGRVWGEGEVGKGAPGSSSPSRSLGGSDIEEKIILLVEDNPDDTALTERALKKGSIANRLVVRRMARRRLTTC